MVVTEAGVALGVACLGLGAAFCAETALGVVGALALPSVVVDWTECLYGIPAILASLSLDVNCTTCCPAMILLDSFGSSWVGRTMSTLVCLAATPPGMFSGLL